MANKDVTKFLASAQILNWQRMVIAVLALFLIVYHVAKISDIYFGENVEPVSTLIHTQSLLRLAVIASMALAVFRSPNAIWGMWLSISALVISQYVNLWQTPDHSQLPWSANLPLLKGFIIPVIITILYQMPSSGPPAKATQNK